MKTVLVTGGSKGIGLETVKLFVRKGYNVITCSRTESTWQKVLSDNPDLLGVNFKTTDLTDVHQVNDLFEYINIHYGPLDIAVNNASPKIASKGTYENIKIDALYSTMISDFWSHALCLKYELISMKKGACIVNVSSVNGLRPTPEAAMYSATKHAMEGLTKSVAIEAIRKGVRVNAIAPGVVWTPRWEERQNTDNPNFKTDIEKIVPIRRFAEPEEIAGAIGWLCSEEAHYIVGHTLVMDGGLSLA